MGEVDGRDGFLVESNSTPCIPAAFQSALSRIAYSCFASSPSFTSTLRACMYNRLLGLWDYARMLSLLIIIGGRWPDLEPISTRNLPLITQTEYPQSNQPGGTFSRYQKKFTIVQQPRPFISFAIAREFPQSTQVARTDHVSILTRRSHVSRMGHSRHDWVSKHLAVSSPSMFVLTTSQYTVLTGPYTVLFAGRLPASQLLPSPLLPPTTHRLSSAPASRKP